MPINVKSRKLEAYSLHLRNDTTPVDYAQAFGMIAGAPIDVRQFQAGDKLVALPSVVLNADIVEVTAYEGPVGVNPLIFDAGTGAERYEALDDDQIIATRTYAILDLAAKEGIIEFNQRGAKARDIAEVLEDTGRRFGIGEQFTVELLPVADASFLEALDRFGRIKVARLRVAEPNFDWHDNFENLNVVGAESHARSVELVAVANRNDSLAKERGAVHYIRQMIVAGVRNLKGASVQGVRLGETADTTISLSNYVQHQKVNVRVDQHGHVIGEDIKAKLREYLQARRATREQR
jgi:hypothetical protein